MEIMDLVTKPEEKLPVLRYLKAMLDFGFYTFTCPFMLVWTPKKGYFMYTSRVHQVFCCLIQILVIYESISWLCILHRVVSSKENSYHYMRIAQLVKCTTFCFVFIYTFWLQKRKFSRLVKKIRALDFLYESSRSDLKTSLLAYGICFCAVVWAVAEFSALNIGLIPLESGSGGRLAVMVEEARHLYFPMSKSNSGQLVIGMIDGLANESLMENSVKLDGLTLADVIVTVVHAIAVFPHYVCVNSADKIVLLLAIFCRTLVIDFVSFAKKSGRKMDEVFQNYEALKDQIHAINDVMGMLILFFVGGCLPFYPTWTGVIFFHKDASWFQYAQFISFFGMFFLILGVTADVNLKIGEFYVWISSKEAQGTHISPNRFNSIMMDMYSEQVALRGKGFFKMTYGFFGTVLSVIVTYTIIIVQFQMSGRHK